MGEKEIISNIKLDDLCYSLLDSLGRLYSEIVILYSIISYMPFKKSCTNAQISPHIDGRAICTCFIYNKPTTDRRDLCIVLAMVNGNAMEAADLVAMTVLRPITGLANNAMYVTTPALPITSAAVCV